MDDVTVLPAPRRYKMSVTCEPTSVGTIYDTVVSQVEPPHVEPQGKTVRMTFVCLLIQVPDLLSAIMSEINEFVVAPFTEQPSYAVRPPKPEPIRVSPLTPVTTIAPRRTRVKGGARPSETYSGKIILMVLKVKPIAHPPDFADAFEAAGLANNSVSHTLNRLMREGVIVRCGHAAYRLPTAREDLQRMGATQE